MNLPCTWLALGLYVACTWLVPGFGVALEWLVGPNPLPTSPGLAEAGHESTLSRMITTVPSKIARKQFRPGPQVAAFVPQALYIEMGFSIGFTAAANIIYARQGAASTLIAPPSDPAGN